MSTRTAVKTADPDQYWIERATRIKQVYTSPGSNGRVRYDVGDMEIEVEWFQRDISGGDERRIFKAWTRVVDADGKVVARGQTMVWPTASTRPSCA